MRYGLSTVVPIHTLQLLTYQEMELLACGSPRIDIDVWKSVSAFYFLDWKSEIDVLSIPSMMGMQKMTRLYYYFGKC